jgi:putative transcriptional regulator
VTSRRRFCTLISGGALIAAGLPAAAQQPATALLLVATAKLEDSSFKESVVLVTRHGRSRPLGVILNRPLGYRLGSDFDLPADDERMNLFYGGPVVQSQVVFAFRDAQNPGSAALSLGNDLYLSFQIDLLAELLPRRPRVEPLRVYVGHAGWASGQLEDEIARGDWLLAEPHSEHIFTREPGTLWSRLVETASQRSI